MKIAKWIWPLLTFVSIQALAGSPRYVYNNDNQLVPIHWEETNSPYKWHLNELGYPPLSISIVEQQLHEAFSAWQVLPDSNVTFEYQGTTKQRGSGDGSQLSAYIDGINIISFVNSEYDFPSSVLAVCSTSSFGEEVLITENNNDLDGDGEGDIPVGLYPAGSIFNADIFFDGSKTFTKELLHNVALHEIGHCIGLAHSSVEFSVMTPYADNDLSRGALLKNDDISTLVSYMGKDEAKQRYGTISGQVFNGVTGNTIRGAHVYAVNSDTLIQEVGTYSLIDGEYNLRLPVGNYFLKIEPLDGTHPGLEAERLTSIVNPPENTFFEREYYDLSESSYESGTEVPMLFNVTAGLNVESIDFYINEKIASEFSFELKAGLNYFGYPQKVPFGLTSYSLLNQLSTFMKINRIEKFNQETGGFEFSFMVDGEPQGVNFDIQEGEGYLISSDAGGDLVFPGATYCHEFELKKGLNLVAITCPPANFDSYQLIEAIGSSYTVESVRFYDSVKKQYLETQYINNQIMGDKFSLTHGVAVEIRMLRDIGKFKLSKIDVSPPIISAISPGSALPGDYVLISGQGFNADVNLNVVLLGNQRLPIQSASHNSLLIQLPNSITPAEYELTVITNELISNSVTLSVKSTEVEEKDDALSQLLSGMEVKGSISSLGEQDIYTFVALDGSKLNVNLIPVNSEPGLSLQILSPYGGLLLQKDAITGSSQVNIQNFQIKETGIYTLVVSAKSVGAYRLSFDLDAPQGAARTSVLMGESQVAVKGTELKQPVLMLVTDKRGQPVSNADVVISQRTGNNNAEAYKKVTGLSLPLTTKDLNATSADSINTVSDDSYLKTLKSDNYGLIGVSVAVPDLTNDFQLVVSVPSFNDIEPILLNVKVIEEPIAQIKIDRTEQNCANKCPVGQMLPEPWRATFLNAQGQGIPGVPVEWLVISGGGKLGKQSGEATQTRVKVESDANGKVEVFHKLGEQLYLNSDTSDLSQPIIELPQAVLMTIPGQSAPLLFTAEVKAGPVASISFSRSSILRETLYTQSINSLGFIAKDSFGNPVADEKITLLSPAPSSGIAVMPGYVNGTQLEDFRTNERGIWLGSISIGDVIPTIDEFGNKGSIGLAETYVLNLQVGSQIISFDLDVDMGPVLASVKPISSALIGQHLDEPLVFKPHGFMRKLKFDPSQLVLSDAAILSNVYIKRNYTGSNEQDYGWHFTDSASVFYDINRSDFSQLVPLIHKGDEVHVTVHDDQEIGTEINPTDTRLSCVDIENANQVIFCSGELQARAYRAREAVVNVDNVGQFSSRKAIVVKAVIPNFSHGILVGSTSVAPAGSTAETEIDIHWWNVAKEMNVKDLTGVSWIYPQPISLSFIVDDSDEGLGSHSDIYPGIKEVSGIDLNTLNITLPNGTEINGLNIQDSLKLNQAPNFARIWFEHLQISQINESSVASSPEHFQLIYEPKSSELTEGLNTVKLKVSDSAGNDTNEISCTFNYPTSIECQE